MWKLAGNVATATGTGERRIGAARRNGGRAQRLVSDQSLGSRSIGTGSADQVSHPDACDLSLKAA